MHLNADISKEVHGDALNPAKSVQVPAPDGLAWPMRRKLRVFVVKADPYPANRLGDRDFAGITQLASWRHVVAAVLA